MCVFYSKHGGSGSLPEHRQELTPGAHHSDLFRQQPELIKSGEKTGEADAPRMRWESVFSGLKEVDLHGKGSAGHKQFSAKSRIHCWLSALSASSPPLLPRPPAATTAWFGTFKHRTRGKRRSRRGRLSWWTGGGGTAQLGSKCLWPSGGANLSAA